MPDNNTNQTVISDQYDENEISDDKTQQVFYSDDEIENINPAKKPKIKVKVKLKKFNLL